MSQLIGDKLFKVEGIAEGEQNPRLLCKIGAAMDTFDFCNECKSLGGEMSLFFGDIVVKIDWNDQKISLERTD